uniref:High-potential iron-sulfur protein n=1 Tax=Burkholderia sp. M701 TaxID=326454 RepID=V5YNZ9_9BURK|nr:high-potential iron-sulfur protein [Burkholderia sp. M701]BAO19127.1 high potential iron-sulfur protein [Burkholderia sp. M701]
MKTSRRHFLLLSAGVGSSLVLSRGASAAAPAPANTVNESDPQAQAVGYVADASKVDKAKFPNFAAGQACASCSLFQGKASDTYGGCTLFGDKQVASRGWCSAYSNI